MVTGVRWALRWGVLAVLAACSTETPVKPAVSQGAALEGAPAAAPTPSVVPGPSRRTFTIRVPDLASHPFSLSDHHATLQVSLLGARPVSAEKAPDDRWRYRGALGEADLELVKTAAGIEDRLEFPRAPATEVVRYRVTLDSKLVSVRQVGQALEFIDDTGDPRLRMLEPWIESATQKTRLPVSVAVTDCEVDRDLRPTWDRPFVRAGRSSCTLELSWRSPGPGFYPAVMDPPWTITSAIVPRFDPASNGLTRIDGPTPRMIRCGGYGTNGVVPTGPFAECELYDEVRGTWQLSFAMLVPRAAFPIVYSQPSNRVVVAGGVVPGGESAAISVFNAATGWADNVRPLSLARGFARATPLPDGRIVISGGQFAPQNGECRTGLVEVFNPADGGVVAALNPMRVRVLHSATYIPSNQTVLFAGGVSDCCGGPCAERNDADLYVLASNNVVSASQMNTARSLHGAVVLPAGGGQAERVLVVGGAGGGQLTSEFYIPSMGGNAWQPMFSRNLATPMVGAFAVQLPATGVVLVPGGEIITNTSTDIVQVFNNGVWTNQPERLGSPRRAHFVGVTPAGRAIIAGGGRNLPDGGLVIDPNTEVWDLLANGSPCLGNGECQSFQCVDGVCCNTACGNACDACSIAAGGTLNGTCTPITVATARVCRARGPEACDVEERCNGVLVTCPPDGAADAGTPCRQPTGPCEGVTVCDGTSRACPSSAPPAPGGTTCRAAVDLCDRTERCTGQSTVCPADELVDAGTPCSAFVCTGTSVSCPMTCTSDSACAPGAVCRNGTCVGVLDGGSPCQTDGQCGTSVCANGVCCDRRCGACEACNQPGSVGRCAVVPAGAAGSPACAPFVCNGSASCPLSCTTNAECVAGLECRNAACVAPPPDAGVDAGQPTVDAGQPDAGSPRGAACARNDQCQTGHCADGVCCDSACDGACQACNTEGRVGVCAVLPKGNVGAPVCAPFVCDGAGRACPTTCAADGDCAAPALCRTGVCVEGPPRSHLGFSCGCRETSEGPLVLLVLAAALVGRRRRAA